MGTAGVTETIKEAPKAACSDCFPNSDVESGAWRGGAWREGGIGEKENRTGERPDAGGGHDDIYGAVIA